MPALGGWPQLERLSFDPIVYWPRAVTYAVILLGARVDLLNFFTADAFRVLLVAALTAFAGNYPMFPETVDDRSLGGIKLGRNRDCDDMAMTVVATFNYLKKIPIPNYGNTEISALCMILHAFLKQEFTTAACIVCRAIAHVADPNIPASHDSKKNGHVFAVLSTATVEPSGQCVDLMRDCAVCRSHACVVTIHPAAAHAHVHTRPTTVLPGRGVQHCPHRHPLCQTAQCSTVPTMHRCLHDAWYVCSDRRQQNWVPARIAAVGRPGRRCHAGHVPLPPPCTMPNVGR